MQRLSSGSHRYRILNKYLRRDEPGTSSAPLSSTHYETCEMAALDRARQRGGWRNRPHGCTWLAVGCVKRFNTATDLEKHILASHLQRSALAKLLHPDFPFN